MKCLVSKGHYSSLSGGLYPVQGHTDYALALYLNNDNAMKTHHPSTLKAITTRSLTQLSPVMT